MRLLLLSLAFLLPACRPSTEAPSPNPAVPPDTDMCSDMCIHLRIIGCEEGKPYYDSDKPGPIDVPNATCEDFCVYQQTHGVFVNPRCVAQTLDCDDIEAWRKKNAETECR